MEEQVVQYIEAARDYGLPDEQVRLNLERAGWAQSVVDASFAFLDERNKAHALGSRMVAETDSVFVPRSAPIKRGWKSRVAPLVRVVTNRLFLASALLLLCAGLGFYFLTTQGYWLDGFRVRSFKAVWGSFLHTPAPLDYRTEFYVTYEDDTRPLNNESLPLPERVNISGTEHYGLTANQEAAHEADVKIVTTTGGVEAERQLSFKASSHTLYFSSAPVDHFSTLTVPFSVPRSVVFDIIRPFLIEPKFVDRTREMGRELVHVQATFNVSGAATTIEDFLEQQDFAGLPEVGSQDTVVVSKFFSTVLRAISNPVVDLWLDSADGRLYQIRTNLIVPSAQSFVELAPGKLLPQLRATDSLVVRKLETLRDARRLEDVRSLVQALELYYNDHGAYPEGREGIPQGLAPRYIAGFPVAPLATGVCSDYYNTYWYTHEAARDNANPLSSYRITFCLGNDLRGLAAGVGVATPAGITTTDVCTDLVQPCFIPQQNDEQLARGIASFFSFVPTNARVTFKEVVGAYDIGEPVRLPEAAVDVLPGLIEN